jgi:hypothetical protein
MTNGVADTERIDLEQARKLIAKIWFIGGGISFFLVMLQSIMGRFAGIAQEIWAWFTPTIVPTLGLIVGVLASTAAEDDSGRTVKRFFFRAALWLSIGYLAILLLTMLLEPIAGSHDMNYYHFANYWLTPIQGLVVASLGALFNSRKKTDA